MGYAAPLLPSRPVDALRVDQGRPYVEKACNDAQSLLLDPAFPYGEDLLQFIWEAQLFDRHALLTTAGLPVEVIRPGRSHQDSGPDLQEARVRIAGQQWAGNVEVHVRSSEWNAHGHHHDPAYDGVVLHVVFEHDADVRTSNGHSLPTLELMPRIAANRLAFFADLMRSHNAVPCARLLPELDRSRLNAWLESVLIERLIRKTESAEGLFAKLGGDASSTFYHLLLQAFGLRVNVEPFGMLAHALPWKVVSRNRDRPVRVEALLFGQAGLLQVDFLDEYPRMLQTEHSVLARLYDLEPAPMAAWKFGRMRPVNFPTVRIAQLAALLGRLEGDLLFLLGCDDLVVLRERLGAEPSPYWLTHYLFDRPSASRTKRMGAATIDHLIINAVVPMLFLLGRVKDGQDLRDRAVRLLEQLPAERNSVTDHWAVLGVEAENAARGQALLELRNLYCTPRKCLLCGIGRHFLRSACP